MKRMHLILLAVLLTFTVTSMYATGTKEAAASDSIKIAVAGPLTGDNSEYGKSFLVSAQIMVDKWNAAGGVLGKQIAIVEYDDKNEPNEAASIAQKIVSDPSIVAVLGHFASGVSMTAAPTYQENKIVEISNSASHPDYSKIGNYIFRNNVVISAEFAVLIEMLENDTNARKVGVIAIKTDWGNSAGTIAANMVKESSKLTLIGHEEVLETSDDYGPVIAKFKAAGAEAVICVGMYSLYGPLARQYKEADPGVQLMGVSNSYTQQIIELGGQAVEGLIAPVSFFAESDDAETKTFVAEYKKRFGMEPSALAAQAYDSVGIMLQALKNSGSLDREKFRDAVNTINYPGITGQTTFDSIGDATKVFQKVTIRNGRFVPYGK